MEVYLTVGEVFKETKRTPAKPPSATNRRKQFARKSKRTSGKTKQPREQTQNRIKRKQPERDLAGDSWKNFKKTCRKDSKAGGRWTTYRRRTAKELSKHFKDTSEEITKQNRRRTAKQLPRRFGELVIASYMRVRHVSQKDWWIEDLLEQLTYSW